MLVSMVMAVHNGEKFLQEAIHHALAQTYTEMEFIIVNDGSSDRTKQILDEIQDQRVKVIHLDQNGGAANALNLGIKEASGQWIAIQDADDNSYPTRIEEQVKFIKENPHLVGVATFVRCISGDDDVPDYVYEEYTLSRNYHVSKKEIRKIIFWGCPLTHSSVMFSKSAFAEVGGYDPGYKIAYDYDLWLKLLELGDLEKVPKVLLDYRIQKNSLSHKNGFETIHEIQVAASKAVYRMKSKQKQHSPKVMVIGELGSCENYIQKVAPLSGLEVTGIIDKNSSNLSSAIRKIRNGKIDAIIILDNDNTTKIIRSFGSRYLKYNKDYYILLNTL
ncbi:glycosyltransferase family 2 protein [Paenibacillus sp. BSR1-1]|uniref:glycosyltransferase family 2 protein n=1 Tax=Paenibacillus sp. BSR1-1 TaxID=3020845 RepID=UPI0025B1DB53|nr:glycosyltransferase family 2 protein [Paenibacillus sp. BSR1-1]MDN3017851.1 glycosyltransferase family 2 protein [Paenibacillus sp. BSR1-1]